jgi:hypothetical protein
MRPRPLSPADRRRALVALVVVAIAAWLDRGRVSVAQHAGVFVFVVEALIVAGEAIEGAAAYIAIHLEAVVAWILAHLAWLGGYVASILKSTGAMFAQVWDYAKTFYSDVLKPLAEHLLEWYNRVKDWLKKYLGPVFDFLTRVRTELLAAYKRFVKPFLDAIDIARAILKTLGDLGVDWAKSLDQKLGLFESVITENFLKILGELNKVIGVVNSVITMDLLFKRAPWLLTLKRDLQPVWKMLAAAPSTSLSSYEQARLNRAFKGQTVEQQNADIVAWWNGESNDVGDTLDAIVADSVAFWSDEIT